MLETSEILALEKRWKKYKIEYYSKRVLLLLFLISSVPLAWFMHDFILSQQKSVDNSTSKQIKLPLQKKLEKTPEELNSTLGKDEKNSTEQADAKTNNMIRQYVELNKGMQKELQALRKDLKQAKLQRQKNTQMYAQEESIDQGFLEENLLIEENGAIEEFEEVEEKPRINIESNELKGLDNLQNKFYETKNIIFALMLAEEYYHKKNYKKSLKWALISNEADSTNERSWIIFAKSKAKNGQPKQAIEALKAYLKTHPNAQEIKTLIGKIKKGNY